MTPHFKLGDYDGGVEAGVNQMISVVNGEPLPEPDKRWEKHGGLGNLLPLLLIVVVVAGGVLRAMFGRLFGSVATGGLAGGLVWLLSHLLPIGMGAGVIAFFLPCWPDLRRAAGPRAAVGAAASAGDSAAAVLAEVAAAGADSAAEAAASGAAAPREAGDAVGPHAPARRRDALAHPDAFPEEHSLDAIEQAIARAESTHGGEIRFAVETALTPAHIWHDVGPRAHALGSVFDSCGYGIPSATTAS